MSKLPIGGLKWLSNSQIKKFDIHRINLESNVGYIIECDLSYPANLHGKHHNLPLAPEVLEISFDNLSNYAKMALKESDGQKNYKDVKLLTTFLPKQFYILHAKNLKLYLDLGMKLDKIHRIMMFQQEAFIAPFIEKCTIARQNSRTKFAMDQYKKLANCVYGKTLQDVRNYSNVRLHTKASSCLKAVSCPTYKHHAIIDEHLVQTTHFTKVIKHDKPIFIGFTILELSKHFMYDFFYNHLMKIPNCEFDLGMTDTDSFLFRVTNPTNFWKHMKVYMDFSNYPQDHPLFSVSNKAKLGFFKNELCGKLLCQEFIGLRPKCYALKLEDQTTKVITEKKVCKGLARVAIANRLRFDEYKLCLNEGIPIRHEFHSIQSKKHNIRTVHQRKKCLTHFCSKRYLFKCGIHSAPYGSELINLFQDTCPFCK